MVTSFRSDASLHADQKLYSCISCHDPYKKYKYRNIFGLKQKIGVIKLEREKNSGWSADQVRRNAFFQGPAFDDCCFTPVCNIFLKSALQSLLS